MGVAALIICGWDWGCEMVCQWAALRQGPCTWLSPGKTSQNLRGRLRIGAATSHVPSGGMVRRSWTISHMNLGRTSYRCMRTLLREEHVWPQAFVIRQIGRASGRERVG